MIVDARPEFNLRQRGSQNPFRNFCVMRRLGTQPVAVGEAEKAAQSLIGISSDCALACDDIPDALRRHADFFRQPVSRYTHRFE